MRGKYLQACTSDAINAKKSLTFGWAAGLRQQWPARSLAYGLPLGCMTPFSTRAQSYRLQTAPAVRDCVEQHGVVGKQALVWMTMHQQRGTGAVSGIMTR
jgi:hypothetical protein